MKACARLLFASLLAIMTLQGRAAPNEDWRSYKLAVMQTVVEVALPYARLNELTRRDWQTPYRAARLEWIHSGKGPQVQAFNALLDIKGPFWIGMYGRIEFTAFVNKKPDWFTGGLFDITALKEMMEHRVRVLGNGDKYRFEIVTINGLPWVHWSDYDPAALASGVWASRLDRYTRPVTDELYLDVAIDLLKSSTSERLDWLKEAEPLRKRLKNSLMIRYPASTPSESK
jgi:hypothetical protein